MNSENIRKYECEICNKQYKHRQHLWRHNKEKHNSEIVINLQQNECKVKKEYKCKICDKIYSSASSRSNHIKIYHIENINKNTNDIIVNNINDNKKEIQCKTCNKEFTTRQAKSLHMKKYCKNKNDELTKLKEDINELKSMLTTLLNIQKHYNYKK